MWKLTKIEDRAFGGFHPHDIKVGNEVVGSFVAPPEPGYCFVFYNFVDEGRRVTSKVEEVLEHSNTVKELRTTNSVYKLEEL